MLKEWSKKIHLSQAIEDIYEIREYYQPRSAKYAEQLTDRSFERKLCWKNIHKLAEWSLK